MSFPYLPRDLVVLGRPPHFVGLDPRQILQMCRNWSYECYLFFLTRVLTFVSNARFNTPLLNDSGRARNNQAQIVGYVLEVIS